MEDVLNFYSVDRAFDLDAIKAYCESRSDCARDPRDLYGAPWSFIIHCHPDSLRRIVEGVQRDPEHIVTGGVISAVNSESVGIQFGHLDTPELVPVREICEWIVTTYGPRITNELEVDVTEKYTRCIDAAFEPALPRRVE